MTPWQIAKDSESSHQIALFCFAAKSEKLGFKLAKTEDAYKYKDPALLGVTYPIPELSFLHHCPNGGSRGDNAKSRAIAGGLLKAEGVKAGVLDIFWPLTKSVYCGLYIEMKKPSLKSAKNPMAGCSDEQLEFGNFVTEQGYFAVTCYTWVEAAEILEWYYNL